MEFGFYSRGSRESLSIYEKEHELVCFGISENSFSVEDNLDRLEHERRISVKIRRA